MNEFKTLSSIYETGGKGYEGSFTITGANESPWILLPVGVSFFSVTLKVDSGSAKVQSCSDMQVTIKNDTPTAIIDSPIGVVTTGLIKSGVTYQDSALRVVGLSADCNATVYIRG